MKKINVYKLITTAACLVAMNSCISADVQSQPSSESNIKPRMVNLPNQGFLKNTSEELKKQFPICDDFLNVDWLDKENGFGYVEHDLYKDGKIIEPKKSLIYIHGNQADHMFNLERFGQLESVLEAIKKDKKVYSSLSTIPATEYKGETLFFEHYDYTNESYADNHENVCIPYPDNKKMWLVEGRDVGKFYSQNQIDKYFPEIKKIYPTYKLEWFLKPSFADINNDGMDDYYSTESFIFSTNSGYKTIEKLDYASDSKGEFFNFGVKGTDRKCRVYDYHGGFITTDGKNYFLNNQCNLTQLATY